MLTNFEKNYTGNIKFGSIEARQAFLDLRRAAYESNSVPLQDLVYRATLQHLVISTVMGLGSFAVLGIINLDPGDLSNLRAPIILAHELGHELLPPIGIPFAVVPGYGSNYQSEYSAFHYEDLARQAFRCNGRIWNHSILEPRCP